MAMANTELYASQETQQNSGIETAERPKAPNGPKKYEFIEGGSSTEAIALTPELTKKIVDRLQNRMRAAETLKNKGIELSVVERLLLSSGENAINNFKSGEFKGQNLTTKDLLLAWSSINDELFQKGLAGRRAVGLQETEIVVGEKRNWYFKKLPVKEPRTDTRVTATDLAMTTPYTIELGVGTWLEDKVVSDLEELSKLRLSLARSLGATGSLDNFLSDPTLVDLAGPTSPIWQRKVGFLPHDAVVGELTNNEKILKLYESNGVHNFLELQAKDPKAAAAALLEANQAALTTFAREIGEEYLKEKKPEPEIDSDVIKNQAGKLRGEPKPEEVNPLLATELTSADSKFKTTEEALNRAVKVLDDLTQERYRLSDERQSLPTSGLTSADQETRLKEIDQRAIKINNLITDNAPLRNNLEGDKLLAQTEVESTRIKLQNAINDFLLPGKRLERQKKAKSFDKWAMVADPKNYEKIIDTSFKQTFEDPFTLERLASVKEITTDGETQVEGAERLRQHVFWLIDKANYDPKLARLMLSDETITRAIIWTYKLDVTQITDLKTALPYLKSSQFKAGDLLRFMIHEGLKSAERGNPYLTLDEYYAKPKPELELKAESIYREGMGRIVETTDIPDGHQIAWQGEVKNVKLGEISTQPLTLKNTLRVYRNRVYYSEEAQPNQRFFEALPRTLPSSPPFPFPSTLIQFYTPDGTLKTDIAFSKPIVIKEVAEGSPTHLEFINEALENIDSEVASSISETMTSAVADFILQKTPEERLKILRGILPSGLINIPRAEDRTIHNYIIDFDNTGNFFITDTTNPASPQKYELQEFFRRRLEDYKQSKGVQNLNPAQREEMRREFVQILSPLGLAILQAQQIR